MKKTIIAASALLMGLSPIIATPAFAGYGDRDHRYERRDDRRDWRDDRRDDRRDWRDDRRDNRRDHRRAARWDNRQHNGYTYNGRWYYGPPPQAYYNAPGFSPGYHAWRRGDVYPNYYRSRAVVVDYRSHRGLYAPPRGYRWVRDNDRGEYLLIGIATGVILSAILNNSYDRY